MKFIKKFKIELSEVISKLIINDAMIEGLFPQCLKPAIVIPLFKNGSKLLTSNFRGIEILCSFSKIFERGLYIRINSFLKKNNIINANQFGFVDRSSTTIAAINLLNRIRVGMDNKNIAASIFIDLQKAFDTVSNSILIKKLNHLSIKKPSILSLFTTYLENRLQKVRIYWEQL